MHTAAVSCWITPLDETRLHRHNDFLLCYSWSIKMGFFLLQTLLQFLLDYPVGEARLQRHIAFLLANLGYEHEAGRLAVLDTLSAVVDKFPQVRSSCTSLQGLPRPDPSCSAASTCTL